MTPFDTALKADLQTLQRIAEVLDQAEPDDRPGLVKALSVRPTTLSLALAKKLGITLVARMAPGSFCVYTNPERIVC